MTSGRLVRLAVASLTAFLVGCGPEFDVGQEPHVDAVDEIGGAYGEIVGGTNTTIGANPWQVSLQSSGGFHFCGGSIINENWILTAQHCVNDGGAISAPGRIVAGITNISNSASGQIRTVAQVVPYPGYVDASKGKDVALIRLSSPLNLGSTVQAIGLVTSAQAGTLTAPGVSARITGWGTLTSGGESPDTLQTANVNIVSNADAATAYRRETITADQLAAAAPGTDTCQGDSGGPLTVANGSTRALAGVTSWGYGCADPRYPGMYARVSSFESWIQTQLSAPIPEPVPTVTLLEKSNVSGGAKSWTHFTITVPAGHSTLTVNQFGGTGDADLYVRFGKAPTTRAYDCRPYLNGNDENCTILNPSAGTWYVSVNGYTAFTGLGLKATVP